MRLGTAVLSRKTASQQHLTTDGLYLEAVAADGGNGSRCAVGVDGVKYAAVFK
jgi:hypothetical protein